MQWIHQCSGYTSAVDTPVQWIHQCSGYISAVDTSVQWIHQCSGYISAVDTSVQWIDQCSGYISAVNTSVQWIHQCSGGVSIGEFHCVHGSSCFKLLHRQTDLIGPTTPLTPHSVEVMVTDRNQLLAVGTLDGICRGKGHNIVKLN